MKFITIFLLLISLSAFSQKPCDFITDVNDSIGTYKSTKEYLVYEKNFAGKSSYIFNSLVITDGIPSLNVQFLEKSFDFIKSRCFDKNSRIYLQLNNGKIVTLIHVEQDICGTLIRDDKAMNNRLLTGNFLFMKDSFDALKESPVSFMRVKFVTDTEDFIYKTSLVSELIQETFTPENYFLDYFHCLETAN
jgi:hypothetical protein